jgi:3-deoxy-manno-octulosonate cytidylyltransferase (CMP-KDO synthetase)
MTDPKILGFIPARMKSSRFYGKPLFPILGIPMLGHVIERARMYKGWDRLFLTTCDKEIEEYGVSLNIPVIMTSDKHSRALDRIAEAVEKSEILLSDDDIIVNVQGDEPLLVPDMIKATINPMIQEQDVNGTILSINIIHEEQYCDPNVLKIIHNLKGDILYTSRSPVPYCETFNSEIGAKRIFGLFGFKWGYLKMFNTLDESPLEILESCDSNRLYDNGYTQRIAPFPYFNSYAVDVPDDIQKVEILMKKDKYWKMYNGE